MRKVMYVAAIAALGCAQTAVAQSTIAAKNEPAPRFYPNQKFESFSDISFEDRLEGAEEHFAAQSKRPTSVGSSPGVNVIADASNEVKSDAVKYVDIDGGKLHSKHVTNEEYAAFLKATGHKAPPHWKGGNLSPADAKKPVVNVSFHDAQDYAKWANKRLPSFEEWMSAQDQLDWDLEMPRNEWTSSISGTNVDGTQQVILNKYGTPSNMFSLDRSLETGFRVVTPSNIARPFPAEQFEIPGEDSFVPEDNFLPRDELEGPSEFRTPAGNTILPDQSLERPDGSIESPQTGNPYNYGNPPD